LNVIHRTGSALPEAREPYPRVLMTCARENPDAPPIIVGLMAMDPHLGRFSRHVIAEFDRRIEGDFVAPLGRVAMAEVGATA
jgi:hypothetical protein